MIHSLDTLREISFPALLLKLFLSALLGGALGVEREKRGRPAGFRTYMLVCLGAALTMILGQYENHLLHTALAEQAELFGFKVDVSRLGAQVINGIGFLGVGTILMNRRREVKGLTTAAGLWASGCLGLAVGSGFYEAVLIGFLLLIISVKRFKRFEGWMMKRVKTMSLYTAFDGLSDVVEIVRIFQKKQIFIKDMDFIGDGGKKRGSVNGAIFLLKLPERMDHNEILEEISDLPCIQRAEEL